MKKKYMFGVVKVSDKGQILIPKEAREVFNIKPGDSLALFGDVDRGLALVKTEIFEDATEKIFSGAGKDNDSGSNN